MWLYVVETPTRCLVPGPAPVAGQRLEFAQRGAVRCAAGHIAGIGQHLVQARHGDGHLVVRCFAGKRGGLTLSVSK